MSRDGTIIASARAHADNVPRSVHPLTLATYSMLEKKWREYSTLEYHGPVAISPDGSKLAFAETKPGAAKGVHMRVIDLKTGIETVGPVLGSYDVLGLSWSPDGSRIAYGMNQSLPTEGPPHAPAVEVLELETGKISKVADGESPAWSPSGEWIAYLDPPDRSNRNSIVHPDGSGAKVLMTLPGERRLVRAPVWSPDSTKILLNELYDANKWTFYIHLLDLSTLKVTREFKDTLPVYGWAETK